MIEPAVAALAYAMWDAENSTRLSDQPRSDHDAYIKRAKRLLYAITAYRPDAERLALAAVIAARPEQEDTSNDAFDASIERDVAAGKLDWLIDETKAAEKLPMPSRPEQEDVG